MLLGSVTLALLAGMLSALSPCVLPLVPIVLAAAASEHRWGPPALASGVALSFVAVGLFVATIGYGVGLDTAWFRALAAMLLLAAGIVLMLPPLQTRLAIAAAPVGNWAQSGFAQFDGRGLAGQFGLGLLLGAVWSPCVGPTLGAASLLASQGKDLGHVAIVMLAFGLGAALPLLLLARLSRHTLARWRGRLLQTGERGKLVLGAVLALTAFLILSGLDKQLESVLIDASPDWLTELTTRY